MYYRSGPVSSLSISASNKCFSRLFINSSDSSNHRARGTVIVYSSSVTMWLALAIFRCAAVLIKETLCFPKLIKDNFIILCYDSIMNQMWLIFVVKKHRIKYERNIDIAAYQYLREASLFMGWGAGNNGNHYNSRESPYLRLIFLERTYWPLRNPKKIGGPKFFAPPPSVTRQNPPLPDTSKNFRPP